MPFCPNCGHEIDRNAKFCYECGEKIGSANSYDERKTTYEGEIHKCPSCGEVLESFVANCPACGFEIRGSEVTSTVKEFARKLENTTSDQQRMLIIKNFPIPNTKEDIFEFMLLAYSNFDPTYYVTHLYEEDISDAWLSKIEQCYQKAKFSFGNHPDFNKVEAIYVQIKNDCAEISSEIKHEQITQERANDAKVFKKSKFKIVLIIFAVFSTLCCAVSFNDDKILAGIIAIAMLVLSLTAFLMGSNVIKEKVRNIRLIPAILAFVLLVPYFAAVTSETIIEDETRWDDILLNEYAPKPDMSSAKVMTNSKEEFYVYDIICSRTEYYNYVKDCKEFGYDYEIMEEDEYSYRAYSEKGYQINISYITNLSIELNAPMSMNSIEWPNSDIAKLIPQPKSLHGKIEWEHDYGFVIYIGNTTLDDFREYINSVYNSGFNVDYNKGDTTFWAENENGYHVNIKYQGFNTMSIRIDEPDAKEQ